jgi:hypothetical protein
MGLGTLLLQKWGKSVPDVGNTPPRLPQFALKLRPGALRFE